MATSKQHSWWIAGMLALACGGDPAAPVDEPGDGPDDSFLAGGKADVFGIADGSAEACAIRRLAGEADFEILDVAVGLSRTAAEHIVEFRAGVDGAQGTLDDRWFKDLKSLDDVKYVGKTAFKQLAAYAKAHEAYRCGNVDLQLLAFNDFHGRLKPPSGFDGSILTDQGNVKAGGVEYLSTHVQQLRADNPNTLVVAAGDVIGATPLLSALFHDEPTIEAMNLLGLDVAAVGNHEFDEGPGELLRMQAGGCHPSDGCQDGDGFDGAHFQYLAANVVVDASQDTLFAPYQVRSFRGAHVGIIGLTLEDTPAVTSPAGVVGLSFKDEADTINALVPKLQEQGIQTIVVLLHEGGKAAGSINGCEGISGPVFEIVDRLDPAVDVVVTGHTNAAHICNINDTLVTSAASFGKLLTKVDLAVDELSGDVTSMSANNLVVTRNVPRHAEQTALIAKYDALSASTAGEVVGQITGNITRSASGPGDSRLGSLLSDAQLAATAGDAEVAFMNPGGIRADLITWHAQHGEPEGAVTYEEAFEVQPFGNRLVTLTLSGQQIYDLLEQQWTATPTGEKQYVLQVSAGFTYTWDPAKPLGQRVVPGSVSLNGAPVALGAKVRVTVTDFLAGGGDGFTVLAEGTDRVVGPEDLEAFRAYLKASSPVAPPELGRITRL